MLTSKSRDVTLRYLNYIVHKTFNLGLKHLMKCFSFAIYIYIYLFIYFFFIFFWGGQVGCERRIEVFLKIQKKWGGGRSGRVGGGGVGGGRVGGWSG